MPCQSTTPPRGNRSYGRFWGLLLALLCIVPCSYGWQLRQNNAATWTSPTEEKIPASVQWVTQEELLLTGSHQMLVVRVEDASGQPIPNMRVDWMLNTYPGAVGIILEHDDMPQVTPNSPASASALRDQMANRFAVTYTNSSPETIALETGSALIGPGETWIQIGSTRPGVTYVTAFCPAMAQRTQAISTRRMRWEPVMSEVQRSVQPPTPQEPTDTILTQEAMGWRFPEDSQSVLDLNEGTWNTVPIQVRIYRRADHSPIAGIPVRYSLLEGGPGATLGDYAPDGTVIAMETTVASDATGIAEIHLTLHELVSGTNQVHIEIQHAGASADAEHIYRHVWAVKARLGQGTAATAKTATKLPAVTIKLITRPTTVSVGKPVSVSVVLRNNGHTPITDLVIALKTSPSHCTIEAGSGGRLVSGGRAQWNLSAIAAHSEQQLSATIQADGSGGLPVFVTATSHGNILATTHTTIVVSGN